MPTAAGRLTALLLLVVAFAWGAPADRAHAQAEPLRRIALVIGNATYTNGGVLDNPENDADAIAAKLTSLGFQVTLDKNLGQTGMRNLFGSFMSKVRDGDLVLVYYAGHGIESDGRDYMLPVDVTLETPSSVQFQGIPLDMAYPDKATFGVIIIFDACRDNPFRMKVKGQIAGAHALSPPVGSLVMFSASAGDVAEDGATDGSGAPRKNSVFAAALLDALSIPDASIQKISQATQREVRAQTGNRQAPTRFGDLSDDFIFNRSGVQLAAAPPPAPAPAPAPAPMVMASATPPGAPVYRSAPVPAQAVAAPNPIAKAPEPTPAAAASAPPPAVAMAAPPPPPAPASPPPAAASRPAIPGAFTMASLGPNVLPPPPQLDPVPPVNIPASFCRIEDEIAFLNAVFRPAYDIAYRNNERAIAYLAGLNRLGAEYNAVQSGFVFQIKAQFDSFAPLAAQANQVSNDTLALDQKIRAVPVVACPKS